MIVALDAEAFNALAGPDSVRQQRVRRIMRAAQRLGHYECNVLRIVPHPATRRLWLQDRNIRLNIAVRQPHANVIPDPPAGRCDTARAAWRLTDAAR